MTDQIKKAEETELKASSHAENGDELELKDLHWELSEEDIEQVAGNAIALKRHRTRGIFAL